ncbi:hypothetical protein Ddye_017038 [Dipteronia dyeriana]|uniref:RNase H type-1 domain-containing protein n=1 Tax=Dipteronia dyeriana TaxID=168575 RepID=A0AAD9U8T9_9ROSI|nr:hypothetical protein Ddye_017038 [Dipteronia dyeriana]
MLTPTWRMASGMSNNLLWFFPGELFTEFLVSMQVGVTVGMIELFRGGLKMILFLLQLLGRLFLLDEWVKINVDGSCDTNSGIITACGVLKDHLKNWLRGFMLNKGVWSVLEAELWGLFKGLTIAWNAGYRKIIVEADSLAVVNLLSKDIHVNHPLFSIVTGCFSLITANWCCVLNHIYREDNRLADGLACLEHVMDIGCQLFDVPLSEISTMFQDDWRGLACS